MVFGDSRRSWGASPQEASGIVKRFAEAGGNFIDTANNYAAGESERIVGEVIGPDRARWVLATKCTVSADPEDPNAGGSHRKSLHRAIDASLKRLGTDYIDLYWVHLWDDFTPVEEVLRALDDLVRAGKVLYVGISDTPARTERTARGNRARSQPRTLAATSPIIEVQFLDRDRPSSPGGDLSRRCRRDPRGVGTGDCHRHTNPQR